jgi:hypothetical protein
MTALAQLTQSIYRYLPIILLHRLGVDMIDEIEQVLYLPTHHITV